MNTPTPLNLSSIGSILTVYTHAEVQAGFASIGFVLRNLLDGIFKEACGAKNWPQASSRLGLYQISHRVKSCERLEAKVLDCSSKLTVDNFYSEIYDLLGARVVCLNHDDLLPLARIIVNNVGNSVGVWKKKQVRHNELTRILTSEWDKLGFTCKVNPQGYCSIHFVIQLADSFFRPQDQRHADIFTALGTHMTLSKIRVELQLRTILEEAWGEIDHQIRYEDKLLQNDPDLKAQFEAFSGYIQAGNNHISIIQRLAQRKKQGKKLSYEV